MRRSAHDAACLFSFFCPEEFAGGKTFFQRRWRLLNQPVEVFFLHGVQSMEQIIPMHEQQRGIRSLRRYDHGNAVADAFLNECHGPVFFYKC